MSKRIDDVGQTPHRNADDYENDERSVPGKPEMESGQRKRIGIFSILIVLFLALVAYLYFQKEAEKSVKPREKEALNIPIFGPQARQELKVPPLREPVPAPQTPASGVLTEKKKIEIEPTVPGIATYTPGGAVGAPHTAPPPDKYALARDPAIFASNSADRPAAGLGVADGSMRPPEQRRPNSDATAQVLAMMANQQGQQKSASQQGNAGAREPFEAQLKPMVTDATFAKSIAHPSLTITKGTVAPTCHNNMAINTELPGIITCTLGQDVHSTDGKTKLMTKGSNLVGEYKNGLEIGDERLFILWTRYEDLENHQTIVLDSPGADALGRAGLGGDVDAKFFKRFGAAILFSILEDFSVNLSNRTGNNSGAGTTVNLPNTQSAAKTSVQSVLDIYKNVKPTLRRNQGAVISVIFARDLDFSSVYRLVDTTLVPPPKLVPDK